MSEKALFDDDFSFRLEGTLGQNFVERSPLEILMASEEEQEAAGDSVFGWMLAVVLELVFADERPMDWRYAAKRGMVLMRNFAPALLMGRPMAEDQALTGLHLVGEFSPNALLVMGDDEELARRLRQLLEWIYEKKGKGWVKAGTAKLYVLALGYHRHALKKVRPGRYVRRKWVDAGMEDMTLGDFAKAFGETANNASRARWSWRAGQIMEGLPHAPFQKGRETVEKCRQSALGNGNRGKKPQF